MYQRIKSKLQSNRIGEDEETMFTIGMIAFPFLLAITLYFLICGDAAFINGHECFFHKVTGAYCPGCGGTRAMYYLVHLDLGTSLLCNPFVLYSAIVYITFMLNTIIGKLTGLFIWKKMPIFILIYIGVGILLTQSIIRNVLFFCCHITCL